MVERSGGERAVVSRRRRIPAIWLVPIVAGCLGIWMVVYTLLHEGPTVKIQFETAEGIEAGKTKVKSLSVELGVVEDVALNDDLASVTVVAKLHPEATSLLRDDTRFWVVRPRLGAGGVSGLGTIMSGAYLELQPGPGEPTNKLEYVGLEDVPTTSVDAPGLWLTLIGKRVGSLGVGQPVLFRDYPVGRVEERIFEPERQRIVYRVFIESPYEKLVDRASRFWNASGIHVTASAEGVELDVASLQTLLAGGVAFDLAAGSEPLGPPERGAEYPLYDSKSKITDVTYEAALPLLLLCQQSVRGLVAGAPVEFRGVRIGTVLQVAVGMVASQRVGGTKPIGVPVLIAVEPARLGLGDDASGVAALEAMLRKDVSAGLRATLETGNLLTGALYVSLDWFPDAPSAELGLFNEQLLLPTVASGFEGITRQVSGVLTKVNDLPLERTVSELNRTLADLQKLIASPEVGAVPGNVNASLEEVRRALVGVERTLGSVAPGSAVYDQLARAVTELTRALQSTEGVMRTLDEQPNSIIFDKPIVPDREPGRER